MPYLTTQDMIDRYGEAFLAEVTARDGAPGVVDAVVLQVAIDDAVSIAESYVSGLYNVENPPRVLTTHAAAIAWYRLLGARAAAFEGAKDGYEAAISFLRGVRKGEAALGDETPSDTGPGNPQLPRISAPEGTFSRNSLNGF